MDDAIALEKAAWSAHQAEKIYAMHFNPTEAWESVRVVSGGDTSHHASLPAMRIRLPNGELATTDTENASVFGPHFHRVFNNHRPIDWPVLDKIKQREVMDELDQPISWDDIKKATTKLANNKAPGLNGDRLMHLRHLTMQTSPGFYYSTTSYGIAKLTSTNGTKAK